VVETQIQVLAPDDWRLWRRLRLAALADAPHAFGSVLADWQGDGDREERWRARLELAGSCNLVALLNAIPVGMASGIPADEDAHQPAGATAELISMWVAPEARGQGVADKLIDHVEAWARQERAIRLQLAVTDGNERAAALYRRHGFAETGELGDLMADAAKSSWPNSSTDDAARARHRPELRSMTRVLPPRCRSAIRPR
jgi:ribosomal protein S18 acetylase RimI-like enzyme